MYSHGQCLSKPKQYTPIGIHHPIIGNTHLQHNKCNTHGKRRRNLFVEYRRNECSHNSK